MAAIQGSSVLSDKQANVERFSHLCRQASAAGAKILVLPEACLTGYMSEDLCKSWHKPGRPLRKSHTSGRTFEALDPAGHAEPVPGALTQQFCELARELGVYITVPFVEKASMGETPAFFNTICLASPEGTLVAHYRKNNPWPYVDHAWITAGDSKATVDTPYGRVGLAVCYDVHDMLERYKSDSLWALLYCIAWVDSDTPAWFGEHLPARVAEAGYHVIAANWSVSSEEVANTWRKTGIDGYGYSSVYLSTGKRIAAATAHTGDSIVYAELPVCSQRSTLPPLAKLPGESQTFAGHWRSDFYGPMEEQRIEVGVDGLRAVKVTGDLNVPAGMVTWRTKGIPDVNGSVDAWFRHREDPSDANGFYWEKAELKAVSQSELSLTLLEGGRLRGSIGMYVRVM